MVKARLLFLMCLFIVQSAFGMEHLQRLKEWALGSKEKELTFKLFYAAFDGDDFNVRRLIEMGADVNSLDANKSALFAAAEKGNQEYVELMQMRMPRTRSSASLDRYAKVVEILLEHGADVNFTYDNGVTPLMKAAENGNKSIVEVLLRHKAKVNLQTTGSKLTALYQAVFHKHADVVELLVKNGADVDLARVDGLTPLMLASEDGNQLIVEILLQHKAKVNLRATGMHNLSALRQAAQNGHAEIAQLLLKYGADVNLTDANGITPLMTASLNNSVSVLNLLLEHDADPFILGGESGSSALMFAANQGHLDAARAILTVIPHTDADKIRKNWDKMLAIRFAKKTKPAQEEQQGEVIEEQLFPKDIAIILQQELVQSLVKDQLERATKLINQTNKDLNTAAEFAASQNHPGVAKLLDPANLESMKEIRSMIEENIKRVLFPKLENEGEQS